MWVTENPGGALQIVKTQKMRPVKLNGNVDLGILDISRSLLCYPLQRK